MNRKFMPVRRRKFLQMGIGIGALFLPTPGMLSPILSQRANEVQNSGKNADDGLFMDLVQRYGGEFGGIRPIRRRLNHGRV